MDEARRESLESPPRSSLCGDVSGEKTRLVQSEALPEERESEASLHGLFRFYYRPIYYLFLRSGLAPHDCDDLAQETFLQVFRGLSSFRHDSSLGSWIYKIAINMLRRRLRHGRAAKRRGELVSLDAQSDEGERLEYKLVDSRGNEDSPLNFLLREEQRQRLLQAVAEMPVQMRRCALLRYDRGLKYREIAAVLDLSIQTVKSHLFQARERLQASLSEQRPSALGGDDDG